MTSSDRTLLPADAKHEAAARVGVVLDAGDSDDVPQQGFRAGIACAEFNGGITYRLLNGALDQLEEAGCDLAHTVVAWAPGAFELPVVAQALARRAADLKETRAEADDIRDKVLVRARDLLDEWEKIAKELQDHGTELQYQSEAGAAKRLLYEFLNPELKTLPLRHRKFRANRSMRDVEPSVNLWVKTLDNIDVEEDD